jgi:hypothetical protein
VFGDISVSEETGDYSGVEFRFVQHDTGVTAALRDAAGGLPAPAPVDSLAYDPATDTLTLWTSQYGSTHYIDRYAVTCGMLDGNARAFITETNPTGSLFQRQLFRVENPLPDNP